MDIAHFQTVVLEYFTDHARSMPWRTNTDPYQVLASEIMLQQTQVSRVTPKYRAFLQAFPTVQSLSNAHFQTVLKFWSGLGYNRRAKFLHQAAKVIAGEYGGIIPNNEDKLVALPGIGVNTARAIRAYAYNEPRIH